MKKVENLNNQKTAQLNISAISGSLHNHNFGIDNPIAKGEINTGGLGYKALEIKEPVVIGYYAGTEKNGEHSVIGYYAGNQDANGNDR